MGKQILKFKRYPAKIGSNYGWNLSTENSFQVHEMSFNVTACT